MDCSGLNGIPNLAIEKRGTASALAQIFPDDSLLVICGNMLAKLPHLKTVILVFEETEITRFAAGVVEGSKSLLLSQAVSCTLHFAVQHAKASKLAD
jgi:hypothetical protein